MGSRRRGADRKEQTAVSSLQGVRPPGRPPPPPPPGPPRRRDSGKAQGPRLSLPLQFQTCLRAPPPPVRKHTPSRSASQADPCAHSDCTARVFVVMASDPGPTDAGTANPGVSPSLTLS